MEPKASRLAITQVGQTQNKTPVQTPRIRFSAVPNAEALSGSPTALACRFAAFAVSELTWGTG